MIFGDIPFNTDEEIKQGRYRVTKPISAELHDLLKRLLAIKSSDRPTVDEIMVHPWVLHSDFISRNCDDKTQFYHIRSTSECSDVSTSSQQHPIHFSGHKLPSSNSSRDSGFVPSLNCSQSSSPNASYLSL